MGRLGRDTKYLAIAQIRHNPSLAFSYRFWRHNGLKPLCSARFVLQYGSIHIWRWLNT